MNPRKLVLAAFALASSIPAVALAQPAAPPSPTTTTRPTDAAPPTDTLTAQEREVLAIADQLAADASKVLEQWVLTQAIPEDRLFARMYYPIAKTEPQKWTTAYDALAERDLPAHEDKALGRSPLLQYAIVTDLNGYVPVHNTRFAQPLTGDKAQDYANNRSKRLLPDPASWFAAHSQARFLLQRSHNDAGDIIYDMSVPVFVRGKHWGCARVGFRRSE
jgi:methyl-accepting chemotaxis protein